MSYRFTARSVLLIIAILLFSAPTRVHAQAPTTACRIVAEYPHETGTSTQGLAYSDGVLFESSGGFESSFLAIVDLKTGHILRKHALKGRLFAEGLTLHENRLYLLTWLSGTGSIHSPETLQQLSQFTYRREGETFEGWGLASDGKRLVASSGTARLRFYDPRTMDRKGGVTVTDGDNRVRQLNELEFAGNTLFANIWKQDTIVAVDPESGRVKAYIDLTPLRERLAPDAGVANGIAWDADNKRMLVTGKHWDKLFHIEVDPLAWN